MISIIVPVYNVELYLGQCLDSLLGQTFSDIEVVCVNDGSTDGSANILAEYSKKDSRLKVIDQENGGISAARNRGIAEAKGEWLMFVDSDDWVDIRTCEMAMKKVAQYGVDVVLWAYTREFKDGQSPRLLMRENALFEGDDLRILHRRIIGPTSKELHNPALLHSWGTVWGKLYARDVIDATRFVDTKVVGSAEDVLLNIEIFPRIKKAFYINQGMYHYRKSNESFTGGYNEKLNERWVNLYTLMSEAISANNLPEDFHQALNNRIALGLIGQGLNECRSSRSSVGKIKKVKEIISTEQYQNAVVDLPLKYFPSHWKLFFWAAKKKRAIILYSLLLMIISMKNRQIFR